MVGIGRVRRERGSKGKLSTLHYKVAYHNRFKVSTLEAIQLNRFKLKEALIKSILDANGELPIVESINLVLAIKSSSIKRLAFQANVTPQMVYAVLAGKKSSQKVRHTISKTLGFDPWST